MRAALLAGAERYRAAAGELADAVAAASAEISTRLAAGGTAYFFGNGGSSAQAQHFAAEITGRYKLERRGFAAVALGANAGEISAIANDYGYEQVFARPLEGLVRAGDVAVGLSGSGGSPNVVRALEVARRAGAWTLAFTGRAGGGSGGAVGEAADLALVVPADAVADVQELHLALGHMLCELVEEELAKS